MPCLLFSVGVPT